MTITNLDLILPQRLFQKVRQETWVPILNLVRPAVGNLYRCHRVS